MSNVTPFPLRSRKARLDVELPAGADADASGKALIAAHAVPSLAFPGVSCRYVGEKSPRFEIDAPCDTSTENLREIAKAVEQAAKDALPGCVVKIPAWLNGHLRWRFETGGEFMNGPPLRWLIPGVLPAAEFGTLYGAPGSGKSFLALDLAASLQRGVPFAGHDVPAACRVGIVAAEDAEGMRQRFRAYAQRHGLDPDRDMPRGLSACPDLRVPQDVADLSSSVAAFGVVDLLILDTWAAMQPGADENGSKDSGAVLAACKRLHAEHGCMVLAIAHVGKDASRGERGWSGVRAAADCSIEVQRDLGGNRSWIVRKQKNGVELPAQPFRLVPVVGTYESGADFMSCVVEHSGKLPASKNRETGNKRYLSEVLEHGEARLVADLVSEIAEEHPTAKPRALRLAIRRMIESGELTSPDGGKTVSWSVIEEDAGNGDWLQSA